MNRRGRGRLGKESEGEEERRVLSRREREG